MNLDNLNNASQDSKILFYSAFRKALLTIDHSKYLDEIIPRYTKIYIIIASLAILIFATKNLYLWHSLFSVLILLSVCAIWLFLLFKSVIKYLLFFVLFYLFSKIFNLENNLSYILFLILGVYSIFTQIILSFATHLKIYKNQELFNELFESWQISIRYKGKKYTHAHSEELYSLMSRNED